MKHPNIDLTKIFILAIIFHLSYSSIYSQCNLNRKKDDFGSSQTVDSEDVTLADVFPVFGSKFPWRLDMKFRLKDSLQLIVTHASQSHASSVGLIYFKFTDGTVIQKEVPLGSSEYNGRYGYSYEYTFFVLTKVELDLFATKDLVKFKAYFRHFTDYPVVEKDIKKSSIENIRKDAICMREEFNLLPNTKMEAIVKPQEKAENNSRMVKPTYDTAKVTLLKQWKLVAQLDLNGTPKNVSFENFIEILGGNSFKSKLIISGQVSDQIGQYQLLNDNKLIVFTQNGTTNSATISKLTKTELILKDQFGTSIYVAY